MNRERRARIADAVDELTTIRQSVLDLADKSDVTLQWVTCDELAASVESDIESIQDDEQEAFDNMPESFQQGERGEASQAAIEALQSARDMLGSPLSDDKGDAADSLQSAIDYLNEAQQ